MTKEQEEAIDYVQKQIDYFKKQIKFIEAVDRTYYEAEYKLYKNRVKQFETVLSMLKEKDKEIEFQKDIRNTEKNRHKKTEKSLKGMINKQNTELAEKNAEIEKKDKKLEILEQQYENIKNDFDSHKNNKDINYLDGIHHKKLVEKSIGQIIKKPEECYFDIFEVKVIRNNILYGVAINEDFVSLKQISDESPEECITVIAESPLSGAIYRYNNYGNKEWQLIGTMLGYA